MTGQKPANSPRWGSMTKLVVSLTLLAIVGAFLVHFKGIIVPLLLAFVLAYLFYPVATLIDRIPHLSWRMAVTLLYIFLIIIIGALLTLSGFSLVPQIQSLVVLVENSITKLPSLLDQFLTWVSQTSPVPIDVNALNLDTIVQQLLAYVQPLLGSTGQLLGAIASGAAGIFGWGAFILIVSYFIMAESGGLRKNLLKIEIPGYTEDFNRLGMELQRIWNAFLRGQMIVFILAFIFYFAVLSIFGVRYAIGLALLAGFSKFLPYIGPAIVWVTLGLVSYFQPFKLFGMSPLLYTILVFAFVLVLDQLLDSFITPRIMAQALRVHPAGVLVAALVFADLLGVLGIIIAAPMLATFILFGRYTMRKLLDQEPWPQEEPEPLPPFPWTGLITRLRKTISLFLSKKQNPPSSTDPTKLSDSNQSQGEKT
jgi:predicted PurR-regulated permease PerM